MKAKNTRREHQVRSQIVSLLLELGFPVHRIGFQCLCIILRYSIQNDILQLCKDVYPYTAQQLEISDWRAVEHGVREAIVHAWNHGDIAVWHKYFPYADKAPSNKVFILTLSEYLRQ